MTQRDNRQSTMPPLLARYINRCESPANVNLPTYLCLMFMSGRVTKRFFGGWNVGIGDMYDVFGQVCESGALIASRSGGTPTELAELVSTGPRDDTSIDWFIAKMLLDTELTKYDKHFTDPPPSLRYFQNALAWIRYGLGWPPDRSQTISGLETTIRLDDRQMDAMLELPKSTFINGIAFALAYPDRYAKMYEIQDGAPDCYDLPFDRSQEQTVAVRNELYLRHSRDWASLCRPDLAYLIEEVSAKPRGTVLTQPEALGTADIAAVEKRFATALSNANLDLVDEYVRMGLPISMAVHLEGFASAQPSSGLSLPLFLTLAYVSDHFTFDSSGKSVVNFGTLMASYGAICEVGGVIGQTTDIEPLELLPRVLGESTLTPSTEEYWRDAALGAERTLESFTAITGADPTGLLPLYVGTSYPALDIDYPNDVDAIKDQHELQLPFWEHPQLIIPAVHGAFATGIALVRNHPDTFAGKHGVYVDEAPDPITKTYKNPQSETNLKVGSTYSREEQLNLCRVWAELYRPEAKALFEEAS